jgi:hypothetical protein
MRLGLAAHLARLAGSDRPRALMRLAKATGGGLQLINGLTLDFRRPGDGDEGELGGGQKPSLEFCCVIHEKLLSRRELVLTHS